MISDREIDLLEFNVRFGDPETQALLPLLRSDLLPLLLATAEGRLEQALSSWISSGAKLPLPVLSWPRMGIQDLIKAGR